MRGDAAQLAPFREDRHAHQCTQPDQGYCRRSQKGCDHLACRVDIGGGNILTSSITNEAVDELGIKAKSAVTVVVKASDMMIGVD
jgi:molybdopterin-binding protein